MYVEFYHRNKNEGVGIVNNPGKKIESFRMQTNFDGLIRLLADGLYSDPDIFLRELVQNAHDSIVRRKELDADLAGRIDIVIDKPNCCISVTDNGIGMDESDIRNFLAVIGSGATSEARRDEHSSSFGELIGQFGIGMLSSFVVAEKVYVDTLKRGANVAFGWQNRGSVDCDLLSSTRTEVGSTANIFIKDTHMFLLDEKKLKDIIIKYCDFIPIPIYINNSGAINAVEAPWNRSFSDTRRASQAYNEYIYHRFTDGVLDVFPINIEGSTYRAKGILYISDRRMMGINTVGTLDIFIRKMLVKKDDTALLPRWAQFVKGVIDSPDLKPTAARDNIQVADPSYEYIQEKLGDVIIERLSYLAEFEPIKFEEINAWHHSQLKGMAVFYDSFFNKVIDLLLFETNKGLMSLGDYLSKNELLPDNRAPLYFFSSSHAAAQYYRLADAKDVVIINAGLEFDTSVLRKYAEKNPAKVKLSQFENLGEGVIFSEISEEERLLFEKLEQQLIWSLRRQGNNVDVTTKRFSPSEIPALSVTSEKEEAEEKLRSLLDDPRMRMRGIWKDFIEKRSSIKLLLNADSTLIKKLAQLESLSLRHLVEQGVYINAMLYSHRIIDTASMTSIHDFISALMLETLNLSEQKESAELKLSKLRTGVIGNTSNKESSDTQKPEHIRIFMIMPFNGYDAVETAVRSVFENAPYYFEVRLARDKTHKGQELSRNVKDHIKSSHGFIAEISKLNPNVMLEMGAILMTDDNRPIFSLRSSDVETDIPSDLKHRIYINYGEPTDSVEAIAENIQNQLIKDGRFVHGDIELLMKLRKAKFLSRTLLNSCTRLDDREKNAILKSYGTLEAFLADNHEEVSKKTSVRSDYILTAQNDLKSATKEN